MLYYVGYQCNWLTRIVLFGELSHCSHTSHILCLYHFFICLSFLSFSLIMPHQIIRDEAELHFSPILAYLQYLITRFSHFLKGNMLVCAKIDAPSQSPEPSILLYSSLWHRSLILSSCCRLYLNSTEDLL